MANVIVTPNMFLPDPVASVDPGPDYADNLSSSLNIIDQHNHSPGSGVQITPNGLNINTDLAFNANNATFLRSTRFVSQAAVLSLASDIGCLYVFGNELYYNDVTGGNNVQITLNGLVNATSSGISSGTASAAFAAGVLVVKSSSTSFANIDMQSAVLSNSGNITNTLTLQAPTLTSSIIQTLPSVPTSSVSIMQMDTSGNMSAVLTPDGTTITVASNVLGIPNGAITGSQIQTNVNINGKAAQESGKNLVVSNTNATNSLSIVRGIVNTTTATPVSGEGFTVAVNGTGDVTITFSTAFGDTPAVTTSAYGGTGPNTAQTVTGPTASAVRIWTFNGASHADNLFSFIAIGQRA